MKARPVRFRTRVGALLGASCVLGSVVVWNPGRSGAQTGVPVPADAAASPAFTASKQIARTNYGQAQPTDSRNFTLTVDQTSNLVERQQITVSWTGAHPTGGIQANPNSALANRQEYPVVLMECRGVDDPSAPVSQQVSPETCWTHTPDERRNTVQDITFPPFRADMYATAADRASSVGLPNPLPAPCASSTASTSGIQHWVPFIAANGTVYYGGGAVRNGSGQLVACAGQPPESVESEQSLQPDSTTYAPTNVDGTGTWKFTVTTSESNASLGCSSTVTCTLEVIPIEGISCDPTGALLSTNQQPDPNATDTAQIAPECEANGAFAPGETNSNPLGVSPDYTVSGAYWWSASNWRNRIAVPLQMAPFSDSCNQTNTSAPLYFYGSELFSDASLSWEPAFCESSSLFKINHVHEAEPEAKALLANNSIEAALAGTPPEKPFTTPTVQAPMAFTGFSIGYVIASGGMSYTDLKLTPRLLAKLLTESYPDLPDIKSGHPGLSNNPLNITFDPEFQALNPGAPFNDLEDSAATLYSIASSSDVMSALTSYITADPEARSWLDGTPDPWGMTVNPAYQGIALPVNTWPELDTWEDPNSFLYSSSPCLGTDPVPYLPLVASPSATLSAITLNLQFRISNSETACQTVTGNYSKLVAQGAQSTGAGFLIGLIPYADSVLYEIPSAALQSQVAPSAPTKFTDATGRTFVAPSDSSLQASARILAPDGTGDSWVMPYAGLESNTQAAGAYPGAMLMSLDVPTTGLPSTDAAKYGTLMRYAASTGQTPGTAAGDLPGGYLPMTAANGLGAQADYTSRAADAVANQTGTVPPLVAPPPSQTTTTTTSNGASHPKSSGTPTGSSTGSSGTAGGTGAGITQIGGAGSTGSVLTAGAAGQSGKVGAEVGQTASAGGNSAPVVQIEALGHTIRIGSGFAGIAIPLLLLAGLAALAIALASWLRPRKVPT